MILVPTVSKGTTTQTELLFFSLRERIFRYDSGQCVPLQQPLGPPRVPPQGMYGYIDESQEQRYQQEAAAQHHQIAVANAQGLMKSEEQESSGPLYPRYVFINSGNERFL